MKTNHSNRDAPRPRKKAPPPQPAMFRLHAPIVIAPIAAPPAKVDWEKRKETGGGGTRWPSPPPPPAMTSTDAPTSIEKPKIKSDKKEDDRAALDQKLPAKDEVEVIKKNGEVNDSDKDSITPEMNKKFLPHGCDENPPEESSDKTSKKDDDECTSMNETPSTENEFKGDVKPDMENKEIKEDSITPEINRKSPLRGGDENDPPKESSDKTSKGIKNAAPQNNNAADFSSDSDDDKLSKFAFPKTAIKRPRNSASAMAYAKRMAEREEAEERLGRLIATRGSARPLGAAERARAFTDFKMGAKAAMAAAAGAKKLGGGDVEEGKKKPAKEAKQKLANNDKIENGVEEFNEVHANIEQVAKVPMVFFPRDNSSRVEEAAASVAASAGGNLKTPPEELLAPRKRSTRTKKLRLNCLKSPSKRQAEKTAAISKLEIPPESLLLTSKKNIESPREESERKTVSRRKPSRSAKKAASWGSPKSPPEHRLLAKKKDAKPPEVQPEEKAASGGSSKSPPEHRLLAKKTDVKPPEVQTKKKTASTHKSSEDNKAPAEDDPGKEKTRRPTRSSKDHREVESEKKSTSCRKSPRAPAEKDPGKAPTEEDQGKEKTRRPAHSARDPRGVEPKKKKSISCRKSPRALVEEDPGKDRTAKDTRKVEPKKKSSNSRQESSRPATTATEKEEAEPPAEEGREKMRTSPRRSALSAKTAKPSLAVAARRSKRVSDLEEVAAASGPPVEGGARRSSRGSTQRSKPTVADGEDATSLTRRSRRKTSASPEEITSNLDVALEAKSTARRSRRKTLTITIRLRKTSDDAYEVISHSERVTAPPKKGPHKRKGSCGSTSPVRESSPIVAGPDGNLFHCRICLGLGELVCCDGCPQVFHASCLPAGPSRESLENDDDPWYCPECVANGNVPDEAGSNLEEVATASNKERQKKKGSRKSSGAGKKAKARRNRSTSAVTEEVLSNRDVATAARRSKGKRELPVDEAEEEDRKASAVATEEFTEEVEGETSKLPSKRPRKPSLAAAEAKKNEDAAMKLEEDSDHETRLAVSPRVSHESKSPKRKSSPARSRARPAKKPRREGPMPAYIEQKKAKTWEARTAMLRAHKELYNTCDLTHAPKGSVDPLLRNFVLESRKQYKKFQRGEYSTLNADKISELRSMGFDFSPMTSGGSRENHERRFQKQWDEQFRELKKYKAKHGDCLVSCVNRTRNKLGNWVRGQRKLMNKAGRDGFPPQRLAKLEAIGFDFNPMVSGSYITKKKKAMFPKVNANWEKHYNSLVEFKEKHGNIIIGPQTKGYPGLYDWIHSQRKEYKRWEAGDEKALMHDEWITKLNGIGFDWAPMKGDGFSKMLLERQSKHFENLWTKHYRDLQEFKKKNGHCYVYRSSSEDILAGWIHTQRKYKRHHDLGKKTPLTEERITLLNEVGLDWNPALSGGMAKNTLAKDELDEEWEAVFDRLVAYKEEHGHADPNVERSELGLFAANMRKLFQKNAAGETTSLSDRKIAKLESIGFEFVNEVQEV